MTPEKVRELDRILDMRKIYWIIMIVTVFGILLSFALKEWVEGSGFVILAGLLIIGRRNLYMYYYLRLKLCQVTEKKRVKE